MKLTDRQRDALIRHALRKVSSNLTAEKAAALRAFFYPKQAAFFRSRHRLRATRKTRRAGATTGGCRELLARALEHKGFRATYVASTAIEARARAWENDTANGLADIVREFSDGDVEKTDIETHMLGGVQVQVRTGEMALVFSNGSRIELFGADNIRAATRKKRGGAKHVFWIDEAQDFTHLEAFYKGVAVAALQDFKGECWLSGTPSTDCSGMFYDITKEDESDGPRKVGWTVFEFAQVDNPFFGTTPEERWENTAAEALALNGWTVEDPDFQREMLGRWVRSDANYVYAVHVVPEMQLCYAPARHAEDGFPDLELAMDDLPMRARRAYYTVLGADLGTRDDFAFVLWAWCLEDPCLYEVASWKKPGLSYDDMAGYLRMVRERVGVSFVVADAGGGGKPAVKDWSRDWSKRYDVPVLEADKSGLKEQHVKYMNNDIRTGKLRLRSGGVLLGEMKLLRWKKLRTETGLREVDKNNPDHACDAGRYAHRHAYHHRGIVPEDKPKPGTPEHLEREEREHERAVEEQMDDEQQWWS